jgi:hypothetical protein
VEKGGRKKVHNRKEWKKLLRTARNRRILYMPKEIMSTAHVRSINHETKLPQESLSSPATITNTTITLILKFIDNLWDI